jgi:hypothetical protein
MKTSFQNKSFTKQHKYYIWRKGIMTHCWLCGASEIKLPNSKYTYYGKILGKKVQKTIRVCICCSAMQSDEDIREEVAEIFGWDYNEEDD